MASVLRSWALASSLVAVGVASIAPPVLAAPGVAVQDATPTQKKDAQNHYDRGAKLFEQKKWDEALAAFKQSYEVVRSPNAHLMLARSQIELGQLLPAYEELTAAEEEARGNERYAATLEKIHAYTAEVRRKIVILRVSVRGAGDLAALSIKVGPTTVKPGEPHAYMPGRVRVAAFEGALEKTGQDVDLVAGEDKTLELEIAAEPVPPVVRPIAPVRPEPKAPPHESRLGYYVSGGIITAVGVGGVALGTALYMMAKSDFQDLEDVCGPDFHQCPKEKAQQIQDGRDKQAFGVIGWAAGGVATGLGVGLLIAGATRGTSKREASTAPTWIVGPGFVGVTTKF